MVNAYAPYTKMWVDSFTGMGDTTAYNDWGTSCTNGITKYSTEYSKYCIAITGENGFTAYPDAVTTKVVKAVTNGFIRRIETDICSTWVRWNEYYEECYQPRAIPLSEKLKKIIDERQLPAIHVRHKDRKFLSLNVDVREQRARETLRRLIGDDKFKSLLKNGFVSVRARSGLVYQIFPDHGITCVFDKGIMVERLCVVMRGNFPPTDSLIVRYLMVLNNESQFRDLAIKHGVYDRKQKLVLPSPQKSLNEIFNELKAKKVA